MATTKRPVHARAGEAEAGGASGDDSQVTIEERIAEIRRAQAELEEQMRASEEPAHGVAKRRRKR
jgi:hypothetical protein